MSKRFTNTLSHDFKLLLSGIIILFVILEAMSFHYRNPASSTPKENKGEAAITQISTSTQDERNDKKAPLPTKESSSAYILDYITNTLPEEDALTAYDNIDLSLTPHQIEVTHTVNTNFQ